MIERIVLNQLARYEASSKSRRKWPRGYSLVEMMAVIAIISVLAALALPTVKNVLTERKTSVAAVEVKGFLEAARARAIARGRPVTVILERLSSRSDGYGLNPSLPISAANPPRTLTAENPPYPMPAMWTPADPATNFEAYNAAIRMTMAESLRPLELDAAPVVQSDSDGDSLPNEPHLFYAISESIDRRLGDVLTNGAEIDFVAENEQIYAFRIVSLAATGAWPNRIFTFRINNDGDLTHPFGSVEDVNLAASGQRMMRPYVAIPATINRIRINPIPRPLASTVDEMPRGSCIDLSLSGLAFDDPNISPRPSGPAGLLRDCRRQFASDWILPSMTDVPMPHQLRPIYLTFSSNGTLSSIQMNAPGASGLIRIEPQADVFLFVGRLGQVTRVTAVSDLVTADDANIKSNLADPSAYWLRISPNSGAITVSPVQSEHILEDMETYRSTSVDEPIGHLIYDSRTSAFTAEGTAQ